MIGKKDILDAYKSIKADIGRTPLIHSQKLSEISGANVYLKMEHLQLTNSFKIRGVLTKIKSLPKNDFSKPFIAASTGNHAAAFGYASEKFDFKGKLFLPENIGKVKINGIAKYAFEIFFFGKNSIETEAKATAYAKEEGTVLIHPYNDIEIIKGQGTIAVEIEEQLPYVDTILAPIGGGGLISGVCSYFSENEEINIIGCQPENASEMYDSIRAGKIVVPSTLNTIADAAAGGIEDNAITFKICKELLTEIKLIDEEAIKKAVAFLYKYHDTIIEPTAALPVAAILKDNTFRNKNVVLILTGKKINKELLTEINENYGDYY